MSGDDKTTQGDSASAPATARLHSLRGQVEMAAIILFVLVNLTVPWLFEDLFPFTSAPMFRDQPDRYCNYTVLDPDGNPLAPELFLLQRIYDGNPPGMGVGIQPPPVLERTFGTVASKEEVLRHVGDILATQAEFPFVTVRQEVIGPTADGRVDVVESAEWKVARPDPGNAPSHHQGLDENSASRSSG